VQQEEWQDYSAAIFFPETADGGRHANDDLDRIVNAVLGVTKRFRQILQFEGVRLAQGSRVTIRLIVSE
jgi:hypothetical protein